MESGSTRIMVMVNNECVQQIPVCRVDALALKNCNLRNRHLPYLPIRAIRQLNIGIGSTYPF